MSEIKIINGQSLPNIPWQERPADLEEGAVLWRYTENPVMGRNPTPKIGRIFNSAVVPWQDGYIAVLRGEQVNGVPHVYLGRSKDGIHWNVDRERVQFVDENGEPWMPNYAYDPRLVKVEDTYYIIWCTDFHGAAIGMAKTKDFSISRAWRTRLSPITAMPCCFRGKSAACTRCCRARRTPRIRRSGTSSSPKAPT